MYNKDNIIIGPCSIESSDRFFKTAEQLSDLGFHNIRGGVWKPRTKPGGFEGFGELALDWINKYKRGNFHTKVFCEVANANQLFLAYQAGIDGIWIGARTTVDPFAVQEIADTLAMIDDPKLIVGIKNPVCPDLDLWDGAIQRVLKAGIPEENIIAMFRGFKVYKTSKYRNEPIWRIPLELRTRYPNIKMYIDPSHIAGDSKYVEEILDMAFNVYDYDGAIIECHCDPNNAWTDAKQQLTPSEAKEILDRVFQESKIATNNDSTELDMYREAVDEIDDTMLELLEARLDISKKIGEYKKANNLKPFQKDRWSTLLEKIIENGEKRGLDKEYIESIWEIIHEKSIEVQK